MIRPWRSIALLVVLLTLAGCATGSSSRQSSSSPRVRCLSDPGRDAAATSRPLFFLFCVESP